MCVCFCYANLWGKKLEGNQTYEDLFFSEDLFDVLTIFLCIWIEVLRYSVLMKFVIRPHKWVCTCVHTYTLGALVDALLLRTPVCIRLYTPDLIWSNHVISRIQPNPVHSLLISANEIYYIVSRNIKMSTSGWSFSMCYLTFIFVDFLYTCNIACV